MTINIDPLSLSSIMAAIEQVEEYTETIKRLEWELPKRLAVYGVNQANVYFSTAAYDILVSGGGFHPSDITVVPIEEENGWSVQARGSEVCFVEFGAGVHFNRSGKSYKGNKPPEITPVGEWGYGLGKRDAWGFRNALGQRIVTHGTPANNCMFFASRDIRDSLQECARGIIARGATGNG